jgi:lysyl oxidase
LTRTLSGTVRIATGIRAGSAAAGLILVACLSATPALAAGPLEPDLTPEPASDLSLVYSGSTRSALRLTTTIRNAGRGPLELNSAETGEDCDGNGDPSNDRLASQRVFDDSDDDGIFDPAVDTGSSSYEVGCLIFHPAHNHWHLSDFSDFELLTPSGTLVAATNKVSFCLADNSPFDLGLPGAPATARYEFNTCAAATTEGISVGWRDTYSSNVPGQFIDIGGVPDGDYCVAVTADPDNLLRETSDSNNLALRGIALRGNTVVDSPQGCTPPASPAAQKRKRRRCRGHKARSGKRRKLCRKKRRKSHKAAARPVAYAFFCPASKNSDRSSEQQQSPQPATR